MVAARSQLAASSVHPPCILRICGARTLFHRSWSPRLDRSVTSDARYFLKPIAPTHRGDEWGCRCAWAADPHIRKKGASTHLTLHTAGSASPHPHIPHSIVTCCSLEISTVVANLFIPIFPILPPPAVSYTIHAPARTVFYSETCKSTRFLLKKFPISDTHFRWLFNFLFNFITLRLSRTP
jgi:hypothetical protein